MSESTQEQVASLTTIRRVNRELAEIHANPSAHWNVQVIGDNLLEYHFTIRGPPGTDFEGGLYHGRLLLPFNYPFAAPSIMLLNPSGRFEVGKKICLTMTSFHSELWQPAWGIRTMMEALRSFFPTPGDGAVGALDWPSNVRKKIAGESGEWVCETCKIPNSQILPFAEESVELPRSTPAIVDVEKVEADTALSPVGNYESDSSDSSVEVPVAAPQEPEPRAAAAPVTRGRAKEESAQLVLINFAIYSVAFIIIALIIDIIRNPDS
jgi:ubiquitin-conjugating enzyme E2 J1